jgi:uncharacterized membrane protein YfbV (UPF0208 family)
MPLSEDRTLAQISIQAKEHMKAILTSLQATGLPITGTYWLSELILSQPIPNGNGHKPAPCGEEGKQ